MQWDPPGNQGNDDADEKGGISLSQITIAGVDEKAPLLVKATAPQADFDRQAQREKAKDNAGKVNAQEAFDNLEPPTTSHNAQRVGASALSAISKGFTIAVLGAAIAGVTILTGGLLPAAVAAIILAATVMGYIGSTLIKANTLDNANKLIKESKLLDDINNNKTVIKVVEATLDPKVFKDVNKALDQKLGVLTETQLSKDSLSENKAANKEVGFWNSFKKVLYDRFGSAVSIISSVLSLNPISIGTTLASEGAGGTWAVKKKLEMDNLKTAVKHEVDDKRLQYKNDGGKGYAGLADLKEQAKRQAIRAGVLEKVVGGDKRPLNEIIEGVEKEVNKQPQYNIERGAKGLVQDVITTLKPTFSPKDVFVQHKTDLASMEAAHAARMGALYTALKSPGKVIQQVVGQGAPAEAQQQQQVQVIDDKGMGGILAQLGSAFVQQPSKAVSAVGAIELASVKLDFNAAAPDVKAGAPDQKQPPQASIANIGKEGIGVMKNVGTVGGLDAATGRQDGKSNVSKAIAAKAAALAPLINEARNDAKLQAGAPPVSAEVAAAAEAAMQTVTTAKPSVGDHKTAAAQTEVNQAKSDVKWVDF